MGTEEAGPKTVAGTESGTEPDTAAGTSTEAENGEDRDELAGLLAARALRLALDRSAAGVAA